MSRAALRALARIAWRDAWRARARSGLIALLIAMPVGFAALGSVAIRSTAATPERLAGWEMGSADLMFEVPFGTDPSLTGVLPDRSRVVRFVESAGRGGVPDHPLTPTVTDAPLDDPMLRGRMTLRDGRAPRQPGEVAISPSIAKALDARIGDAIKLDTPSGSFRVTGVVARNDALGSDLIAFAPGRLNALEGREVWLVDISGESVARAASAIRREHPTLYLATRQVRDAGSSGLGVAFLVAALALFEVALVAAAALSVSTRLQFHRTGMLGAIGAGTGQRFGVVVLGGLLLGAVGAGVGAVTGIAAGVVARPVLEQLLNRVIPHAVISASDVAGAFGLGVVAALAAAIGPAWTAGHVSIVEALGGHRSLPPSSSPRVGMGGIAAVVAGTAMASAGALARPISIPLILLGSTAAVFGFFAVIPVSIGLVGRTAASMPLATRLALRDVGRNRRRMAPAIAAIMACLTLAVAVSTFVACSDARDRAQQSLSDRAATTAQAAQPSSPGGRDTRLIALKWSVLSITSITALGILAIAVALVTDESRATLRTMASVGMNPATHRRFAAMQALVITGIGAVLALPAGVVPTLAVVAGRGTYPLVIPWATLLVIAVGVPSAAAAGAWLLAQTGETPYRPA